MAYRVLAWFLRVVVRVFFRQIEVAGLENVPREGPVIFAGNHPNSLIDPILIITSCGRKVHFAAKDTLFKGRLLRAVLRGLGAVPLARKMDKGGGDLGGANDAAFEHMFGVLEAGGTIGIFPEGISHDESQLAKLKTGAARLALGGSRRAGRAVAIVPCGLVFIHPKRFRSRVLVQYGPPLEISGDSTPETVREVTGQIDTALRRLTINAPDWETVRALDTVRRLYQPQEITIEERVELARRFNTYYGTVAADPRVVDLMVRVRAYQHELDELGLTDRELARDLSKLEVSARLMRHVVLVAWWLPLSVPGAPWHLPPLLFARLAGPALTPRKDVIATTKMLIGMLIVLLAYAATIAYAWWRIGFVWAGWLAILLPLSGIATLHVLDRARLVRRAGGVLVRRMRFRREVAALRGEREQLVRDVIAVVNAVKPTELALMFPRGETAEQRDDADLDAELDRR
jgi:1-acyl-sn-glycerol-3-phosphate acyltransferase